LWLERIVHGDEDSVGGMRGAGHVGVRQDGEQLRWRAPEHAWRVDVAHRAGERRGHRLQRFVGGQCSVHLDEKDAEVALVAVRPRELVLEHGPHESIVEEARRAVDDVQRLGLWIVGPHSAGGTEHRTVGKWRPACLACLRLGPAAEKIANRHSVKPISRVRHAFLDLLTG